MYYRTMKALSVAALATSLSLFSTSKKARIVALTALWMLALSGFAYGSEILVNGNFATGSISPWTDDTRYDTGTGWSVVSSGCLSIPSFCATDTGNVGLEQTFAGVATSSITDVSFFANNNDYSGVIVVDFFYQGGTDKEFVVTPAGGDAFVGWEFFDVTSDLSANAMLVGFEVWGNGGSSPTLVDDLSITMTPIPEPGMFCLFGSGLFCLFVIPWARRRWA